MILPRLVYRSLRQHAVSTAVTAASIALACGLLMTVWMVKVETRRAFVETTTGFDAVLGARGSKLQLVLNALFHLESSPGNVSAEDYAAIKRHPAVKTAIPIAAGDNLRGWRIVGTVPELFTGVEYTPGRRYAVAAGGRLFDEKKQEAVVGAMAAKALWLRVGSTFQPHHGLTHVEEAGHHHEHEERYVVTGILEPTGTPADRVLWIPLQGVQTMSGHAAEAAEEVSAVLLQFRAPAAGMMLDRLYNREGSRLTLAYPAGAIVGELFNKLAWLERVLALVAYLVAAVAGGSVLAGIHASMAARRRDIAILRALGARRSTVCGAVVAEAAVIGALGAAAGVVVYAGLFAVVAGVVRAQTGVMVDAAAWHPVLVWAPLGMIALGAVGGIVPAWSAYRTPVAENLTPVS